MTERNVLGGPLEECGTDPMTGFTREGCCTTGPEDIGSHTVCAVVTEQFLAHQQRTGNDLITPQPQWRFPGLHPGDRWCVVAARWLQAYEAGAAFKGNADIRKALAGGGHTWRVQRERRFAILDGDAILTGALDRLVLGERDGRWLAADLVDFKTDQVAVDDRQAVQTAVAHYRPQVDAYRRAVARLTGLSPDRISARLLFVGAGLVARV